MTEWMSEWVSEWGAWLNQRVNASMKQSKQWKNISINRMLTSGALVAKQMRVSTVRSEVCVCVYVHVCIPRPHQQTAK